LGHIYSTGDQKLSLGPEKNGKHDGKLAFISIQNDINTEIFAKYYYK